MVFTRNNTVDDATSSSSSSSSNCMNNGDDATLSSTSSSSRITNNIDESTSSSASRSSNTTTDRFLPELHNPPTNNPRPTNRARTEYLYSGCDGMPLPRNRTIVTISELDGENPDKFKTLLFLQVLRIVAGGDSTTGKAGQGSFSFYTKGAKQKMTTSQYHRMILCRDLSGNDGEVCYLIEDRSQNKNLWNKDTTLRDNGVITIGTCFAVANPKPIMKLMSGDIPLLITNNSVTVLKTPTTYPEFHINRTTVKNSTKSFCIHGMRLKVTYIAPAETTCSGLFCDRQRAVETTSSGKACGCYSMDTRRGNMVTMHDIVFIDKNGEEVFDIQDFTSLKFSSLFQDLPFPVSTRLHHLDNTDHFDNLFDCITDIINHVNGHNGFTVSGWYKKGEVDDQTKKDAGVTVDSGIWNIHPVHIIPTVTGQSIIIDNKKFQVSTIHNER